MVKFEEKGLAENFSELPLCMCVAQRQSRIDNSINEGLFEVYQTYILSFSAQLPNNMSLMPKCSLAWSQNHNFILVNEQIDLSWSDSGVVLQNITGNKCC